MAICNYCNKEMTESDSCIKQDVEFSDGTKLPQSTYHFHESDGRCHDCNIKHGGYHHPGCDVERCPKCSGQLISCHCLSDNNEDE